ncbi:MAG TPA: patatin-like phospholipase family protein [Terriglobales bacterium]|nr:patatin-like phospholipase family protein [Terriglobales bacterium]
MPDTLPANSSSPPKRLLSLDGGGIRGLIEAEVLSEMENQLKQLTGRDRPLCEHFDLIGGTSTGAILAASLALGLRAADLRDFYLKLGKQVFSPEFFPIRFWHKYPSRPLEKALQDVLGGDTTLGDSRLRTLLLIVSKNTTLGSTWFFTNNKKGKFFSQNRGLPLWQIVRASTAAPTYFPPQRINIPGRPASTHAYEFVDGGVSMYNNPSMQLFLEATEPDYNIGWPTGVDNLLLLSLGAGFSTGTIAEGKAGHYNALNWAQYAIEELMGDANLQQNTLMHLLGERPVQGERVAGAAGRALEQAGAPTSFTLSKMSSSLGGNKLLTYQRITIGLTPQRLEQLGLADINPVKVSKLDCVDQMANLQRIGRAIAIEQVNMQALRKFFQKEIS